MGLLDSDGVQYTLLKGTKKNVALYSKKYVSVNFYNVFDCNFYGKKFGDIAAKLRCIVFMYFIFLTIF